MILKIKIKYKSTKSGFSADLQFCEVVKSSRLHFLVIYKIKFQENNFQWYSNVMRLITKKKVFPKLILKNIQIVPKT